MFIEAYIYDTAAHRDHHPDVRRTGFIANAISPLVSRFFRRYPTTFQNRIPVLRQRSVHSTPTDFRCPRYTSRNRDLDEDIEPVQRGPQPVRFHQRSVGVVRQVGIDLQTIIASFTALWVVERPERVGHAPDVALTEVPYHWNKRTMHSRIGSMFLCNAGASFSAASLLSTPKAMKIAVLSCPNIFSLNLKNSFRLISRI